MICTTAPKGIAHSLVRAIEVIDVPRRNPTIVAMPSRMQGGEASPLSTLCRGTGAEAASRAPRARDQGRACARRASSHKSSPRARILSIQSTCACVDRSERIVTVVAKKERRAWLRARASV